MTRHNSETIPFVTTEAIEHDDVDLATPVYAHRQRQGTDSGTDAVFCRTGLAYPAVEHYHVPRSGTTSEWIETGVLGHFDEDYALDDQLEAEQHRVHAKNEAPQIATLHLDGERMRVVALELHDDVFDDGAGVEHGSPAVSGGDA